MYPPNRVQTTVAMGFLVPLEPITVDAEIGKIASAKIWAIKRLRESKLKDEGPQQLLPLEQWVMIVILK